MDVREMRNEVLANRVVKNLESRNMEAYFVKTKEEALKKAEQAVLQEKQIEKLTEASEQWEKDRTILQKDIWRNLLSSNMTRNQF